MRADATKRRMPDGTDAGAPLRVLLTSTSFPTDLGDWRGLFMRHLVDALSRRADIALDVWAPRGEAGPGVRFDLAPGEGEWLARLAQAGGIAHLLRQRRVQGVRAALRLLSLLRNAYRRHASADVLHVNWLQNALPVPAGAAPPLLATALGTDMQLLRLPGMRWRLRRAFRGRPVVLCPNAEWMVPVLERAFGDVAQVQYVPFGIDPRWYVLERTLDAATPKWLCVSRLTQGKLGPLFEWTAPAFAGAKAELHLFGPMQESIDLPPWVHWHGPASPDALRETWFPQAHGLITLSQHAEGRPQVMLEALAAGLPIIASRLPAHDDLLRDGDGGVLCADARSTLAAIDALAEPGANRALGERGRQRMRTTIGTWDDCAARYAALYRELHKAATS